MSGKFSLGPNSEIDLFQDIPEAIFEFSHTTVVENEEIGHSDRAAFFHFFDLTVVAFANRISVKRAIGTLSNALIP